MKKIAYITIGLAMPVFAFSQSTGITADSSKKQTVPVSAVQAIESKTTLPAQQAMQPKGGVAEQLKSGQQPSTANPANNQSKQPASAVQVIEQTHQDPYKQSGGNSATSPH